jgi:hypothetical protein
LTDPQKHTSFLTFAFHGIACAGNYWRGGNHARETGVMRRRRSQRSFIDYYEMLQLSQNADFETIERVYRFLARRYHPDTPPTGDAEKFKMIVESYSVLSDPEKRAGYDVEYERSRGREWKVF